MRELTILREAWGARPQAEQSSLNREQNLSIPEACRDFVIAFASAGTAQRLFFAFEFPCGN